MSTYHYNEVHGHPLKSDFTGMELKMGFCCLVSGMLDCTIFICITSPLNATYISHYPSCWRRETSLIKASTILLYRPGHYSLTLSGRDSPDILSRIPAPGLIIGQQDQYTPLLP